MLRTGLRISFVALVVACSAESGILMSAGAISRTMPSATALALDWEMDETSGLTTADGSGLANVGALHGSAAFVPGKFGNAISFDGTSAYVDAPSSPSLALAASQISLAAWVKPSSLASSHIILGKPIVAGSHVAPYFAYGLHTVDGGVPRFFLTLGGSAQVIAGPPLAANVWSHVAGVYDGARMTIYVNGVAVASTPASGTIANVATPLIVGANGAHEELWQGQIDSTQIYGRALSPAEVQLLASSAASDAGSGDGAVADAGSVDKQAPTVPTALTAVASSSTTVALSWGASSDDVGVAGYRVLRNGSQIGTTSSTSFVDAGVAAGTSYAYSVVAFDAAGNASAASASASVTTPVASAISGLDFPSNGDAPTTAFVAFQFLNPHQNGLPFWGANGAGATYVWKYKPRQQPGYYVTFWWSNNGNFLWDGGSSNTYYGAHPYPRGGGTGTQLHDWELAGMSAGSDWTNTLAGTPHALVTDRWYTQALRIIDNGDGTHRARFYIDLPSTANADVIDVTAPSWFGTVNPPSPAITFGDSPWYADFQHERLSGVLRGIKIFNRGLSESDTISEAAADGLVTAQGLANVWYMNVNPTPSDISDKSGKGHHPAWADPSHRAAAYTEGADVTPPTSTAIAASQIGTTSAWVSWTTNEAATSTVEYGTTTSYGLSTPLDATLTTSHGQSLTGLTASTLYHYRVVSRDAANNESKSGDATFTTAAQGSNSGAITHVQSTGATDDGSATSISTSFAGAVGVGQTIVVAASWGGGGTLGCSDDHGNAYVTVTSAYDGVNNQSLGICYANTTVAGATAVTASFGSSVPYRRIAIHQYSGIRPTAAVDVVAQNVANGTTSVNGVTSNGATTTASGDLVFGAVMDDEGVTSIAPGAGFARRVAVNGADLATQDLVQTAAGSIASSQTFGAAHRYLAQMVTFKRP